MHQLNLFSFSIEKLRIIIPIKDTQAIEGQEIVFNCEVNNEDAKAKWLRNDETIFESGKFIMVQKDNIYSLRIKDTQLSDDSNYTIALTNQRGEHAKSSAKLIIKGKYKAIHIYSISLVKYYFEDCILTNMNVIWTHRGRSSDYWASWWLWDPGEEDHKLLLQGEQTQCNSEMDEGRPRDYLQQAHPV